MTSMNKHLLALATVLLLGGCASTASTRYYSLANTVAAPTATATASPEKPALFELAPVAVPERLARPQLVIRQKEASRGAGGERLLILEEERWSSAFNHELRDALASGIAGRLGAVDVTYGGRPRGEPVYRIAVQLQQFDAVADAGVNARFGWTIALSDGSRSVACISSLSEQVGTGTQALVQGIGRMVDHIADQIASDVTRLQAGAGGTCQHRPAPYLGKVTKEGGTRLGN